MARAEPNDGHRALAAMEARGRVRMLITQNVDGLHEESGSAPVALHGRVAQVICLGCRTTSPRVMLQNRPDALNPGYAARHRAATLRPDGTVALEDTTGLAGPPDQPRVGATQAAGGSFGAKGTA